MSSSLVVKIKRKGQSAQEAPDLIFLSTSPTRELLAEVHFPQPNSSKSFEKSDYWPDAEIDAEYGYYSPLSIDTLNEFIDFYENKINEIKTQIKAQEDVINDLLKIQVSSTEILSELISRIDSARSYIRSLKGELDDDCYFESLEYYKDLYNKFCFARTVYYENLNDDFELVISAG